jgi:hypothetical protein
MRGKDVGEEWLRIESTAERLRDELVVEFEKISAKLAASAGEGVKVVEIKVHSNGYGDPSGGQHRRGDRWIAVQAA